MSEPADPPAGTRRARPVRSYVLREGRLTRGQEQALERLWPRFGVSWTPDQGAVHLDELFSRTGPVTLEIGFGMGTSLLEMAAANPERNFLGIEVHRPGVGRILLGIEESGLSNLRVLSLDAVEFLRHGVAPASLDRIQAYFPDPWPKKKHHKRRLVRPPFPALCHAALRPAGCLHLATDWENYAGEMLEVLSADTGFRNLAPDGGFLPSPWQRPVTKFEQRGLREGRKIFDLAFERV